jgi:hypothetical protein
MVFNSLGHALSPESKQYLCQLLGLPDEHEIIDATSPYPPQKDNWSCGVYVFAHLLNCAGIEQPFLATDTFDAAQIADALYHHYQHQRIQEEKLAESQAENTKQTRILLDTIESRRQQQGCYLSTKPSPGDIFKPIADFLQMLIWGNVDRKTPNEKGEQIGREGEASKKDFGKSLQELWSEYQKENDKYGRLVLALASLPCTLTERDWSTLFDIIYHADKVEKASTVTGDIIDTRESSREIINFQMLLCEEAENNIKPEKLPDLLWQLVGKSSDSKEGVKYYVQSVYPKDEVQFYIKFILERPREYDKNIKLPLNDSEAKYLIFLLLDQLSSFQLNRQKNQISRDRRLQAERASMEL